jgi:AcrR family transcriptional regulator
MTNETGGSREKRPYRMSRRADSERLTRLRITESAVELHGTLGPARTSISAIAEHAGVRRSTVYRHFPDETSLFTACTAHWWSTNPFPKVDKWTEIADPEERLRTALTDLYAHYRATERMLENILRDEPTMPILTKMLAGYRTYLESARSALTGGRPVTGPSRRNVRAAIGHALAFTTWRSLTGDQGLADAHVVMLMCRLVESAAAGQG